MIFAHLTIHEVLANREITIDVTMSMTDGQSFRGLRSTLKGVTTALKTDIVGSADTFTSLADGKLNGQKAFMTGALKVKGNVRACNCKSL